MLSRASNRRDPEPPVAVGSLPASWSNLEVPVGLLSPLHRPSPTGLLQAWREEHQESRGAPLQFTDFVFSEEKIKCK